MGADEGEIVVWTVRVLGVSALSVKMAATTAESINVTAAHKGPLFSPQRPVVAAAFGGW